MADEIRDERSDDDEGTVLPGDQPAAVSAEHAEARQAHLDHADGAVLRADDLIAGYLPGVNILNGSDLYCQEGELVGIIGPNGAGKSTLLKAIFGLVKVREGTINLYGDDITNLKANKLVSKGVGFVPQTNNVFPTLTIQECREQLADEVEPVPEAARTLVAPHLEVLLDGQGREHVVGLGDEPDAGGDQLVRPHVGDVLPL